jgi:hypothetical protein
LALNVGPKSVGVAPLRVRRSNAVERGQRIVEMSAGHESLGASERGFAAKRNRKRTIDRRGNSRRPQYLGAKAHE